METKETLPRKLTVDKLLNGLKVAPLANVAKLLCPKEYTPIYDFALIIEGFNKLQDVSDVQRKMFDDLLGELNCLKMVKFYKPDKLWFYLVIRLWEILYKGGKG